MLEEQAARILSERETLGEALKALKGVTVFPSEANFFLIRVPDADRTYEALKQQNVLVRNLHPGLTQLPARHRRHAGRKPYTPHCPARSAA